MQIITSHGNTDFDAFASMLAAQKLYPEAGILFSGAKERALERFLENPYYEFNEVFLRDTDPEKLERVILVDVNNTSRIGPLAQHIKGRKLDIVIIDHHDPESCDIEAETIIHRPVGAVTTILVDMLKERNIGISKIEATIFAMGIYEDTGFLTYLTTTADDARQIAFLLECGADLTLISKFLKSELSRRQIDLLNELIANARQHRVNGVRIAISSAGRDDYFPDAAAVVQKQMDVERYPAYVAVIRMGDKLHLIGRSRHPRVDIGAVFERLGGGGHAPAAYATLSDQTIVQATEKVLSLLREMTPPDVTAHDIMTRNLLTLPPDTPVAAAHEEMVRANVNSIPIKDGSRVVGIVTRQQLGKALAHGIEGTLADVMIPEFVMVGPKSSIEEAERLIMEGTQRSVLVGESADSVEGIITRMDLFRRLYIERRDAAEERDFVGDAQSDRRTDLVEMMRKRLPERIRDILRKASEVAAERGEPVFLVGGVVRDLILGFGNQDVDLVVIGDGIAFARDLAEKCGGYIHSHEQFGAAVLVLADDFHVDVVTSRRESYAYPGALPDVESGGLRADLYRRDFTINALAISLAQDDYGQLVDYFGGLRDINNRVIRILHGLSFIDDPTRMLRAVRFAVRLNFKLSSGTLQLLETAARKGMLSHVSGRRIQAELEHLFSNPRPIAALEMLDRFGILRNIHNKIRLDRFTMELLQKCANTLGWFNIEFPGEEVNAPLLYYMVLLEKLTDDERRALARGLDIPAKEARTLQRYKSKAKEAVSLFRNERSPAVSAIVELLDGCEVETILYIHAFAHDAELKSAVSRYLSDYRRMKLAINGSDIEALGLERGPAFGSILRQVRRAMLDGEAPDRDAQLAFARELAHPVLKEQST